MIAEATTPQSGLLTPEQICGAVVRDTVRSGRVSYDVTVDSRSLSPEQAEQLQRTLRPQLAYLGRLRRRMELVGFPPSDTLYRSVSHAHDALQEVYVRVHYCACRSGVGESG